MTIDRPESVTEARTRGHAMDHPSEGVRCLTDALRALIEPDEIGSQSLWDRLNRSSGQRASVAGDHSPKSKPPATLAVVALVIEISGAAREGADDLAGRVYPSVPSNLYAIVDALDLNPNDDLVSWWTEASDDWTQRARQVLGQTPNLMMRLHGARCPYCAATTFVKRQAGETWQLPAISVEWDQTQPIGEYRVRALHCRACDARWLRGVELDNLVCDMLSRNHQLDI